MDYFDFLVDEFGKESDRAAVILVASVAEELLQTLLRAHLVPAPSSSDELFDGPNAPLGTFSSRIEMCFRLGLISSKFTRDLHLIRKIRNDFAHNIHGCSFDDARVKSRVLELSKSNGIIQRSPHHFPNPPSTRQSFLEAAAWMIYHLTGIGKEVGTLQPCKEEWGYSFVYAKDAPHILKAKN